MVVLDHRALMDLSTLNPHLRSTGVSIAPSGRSRCSSPGPPSPWRSSSSGRWEARPHLLSQRHGLQFLTSTAWDVNKARFGVLPAIWGTLYSSVLALLLGGFFGVSIAIFLTDKVEFSKALDAFSDVE